MTLVLLISAQLFALAWLTLQVPWPYDNGLPTDAGPAAVTGPTLHRGATRSDA